MKNLVIHKINSYQVKIVEFLLTYNSFAEVEYKLILSYIT